jgi:SAM-dependent methyltransferase
MLALALLDVQSGESVCDLCAAPGGKASGILERLGAGGFLLANEPIHSRGEILRYMLSRVGSLRYAVTQFDPDALISKFSETFDAVLVDAPCSGQTMVVSGKRDRNAFDVKQIEHSAERQRRILRAAIRLLRPGGRLVYSTCTYAVEENESQVRWLQEEFPNAWEPLKNPKLAKWSSPLEPGCYRLWPHREATSGAFGAGLRLVKELPCSERLPEQSWRSHLKNSKQAKSDGWRIGSSEKSDIEMFGELRDATLAIHGDGFHRGISQDAPDHLLQSIPPSAWAELADIRKKRALPHHGLAMLSPEWFVPKDLLNLDLKTAKFFLAGQSIPIEETGRANGAFEGWKVAVWQENRLGWLKMAGNRYNNHLPSQGYWLG